MIIPRYDQWSNLELQQGIMLLKWDLNSSYGRLSLDDTIRKSKIGYALLCLIRAEQRKRRDGK